MKLLSKSFLYSVLLGVGSNALAQQLYQTDPAAGVPASGGSAYRFDVTAINDAERSVQFFVRPPVGTAFAASGAVEIREGSTSGAVVATMAHTTDVESLSLNVALDFTSGSKSYYAVKTLANADGSITEDEWAGSIVVTYVAESSVPVVRNIRASQDEGKRTVTLRYDLIDSDSSGLVVTLEATSDGGATWDIPVATVSGDIGENVRPGANRRLVWDAGTDWAEMQTEAMRFRITASEPAPPAPTGFALIPGGSFQMGDTFGEGQTDELPIQDVFVSRFWIKETLVTNQEWREVGEWAVVNGYPDFRTSAALMWESYQDHPVHKISLADCMWWCNARSEREGRSPSYLLQDGSIYRSYNDGDPTDTTLVQFSGGYRLPTEAEWEKAARGKLVGKRFPWGDTITHELANYKYKVSISIKCLSL